MHTPKQINLINEIKYLNELVLHKLNLLPKVDLDILREPFVDLNAD